MGGDGPPDLGCMSFPMLAISLTLSFENAVGQFLPSEIKYSNFTGDYIFVNVFPGKMWWLKPFLIRADFLSNIFNTLGYQYCQQENEEIKLKVPKITPISVTYILQENCFRRL